MEETITRKEHEEFARRIDEENDRQNHRIANLEEAVREIAKLTTSIEKMAISMENMTNEQKRQGERLEKLEEQDGQTWRNLKWYILTLLVGGVVGFLLRQIGL